MINSIFGRKTTKKIDSLAQKQAKLDEKKRMVLKESMEQMDAETLEKVFDVVKIYGHPSEKKMSEEIENRYFSGGELEFGDLLAIDGLYKSNYKNFSKRDVKDE